MDSTVRHCGGWDTVYGEDGIGPQRQAFEDWFRRVTSSQRGERPSDVEITAEAGVVLTAKAHQKV